jgi:recombination protein RecA
MIRRTIGAQVRKHSEKSGIEPIREEYSGSNQTISTGSTLLDLAISGGRFPSGGIPGGVLVEIFGPSGCGKTVLLCELAGNIRSQHGEVTFFDPEARLNKQFAKLFGFKVEEVKYETPDTVTGVFKPIREWKPKQNDAIHGVFADSLAALSTNWEMEEKDQYGMRRAKEFSEQLRLTCRVLKAKNILMVCSNQIRQNIDAGPYGQKFKSPGGEAIGFYSSLRLRCSNAQKIKRKRKIAGKEYSKIIGVETDVDVFKSSVWEPYNTAQISIIFDYGVDDIRSNLQFLKTNLGDTVYSIGDTKLSNSIEEAIRAVEDDELEHKLKQETINLWNEIQENFKVKRKLRH